MLLSKVSTYIALFSVGAAAFAPSLPTRVTSTLAAHNVDQENLIDDGGRRAFLASSVITTLVGAGFTPAAYAKGTKGADYKAVAGDIASIIKEDPNKGPTLVRLAWHSSGTYDKMSKDGGSGSGTIRFKEELSHGGNAGLGVTAVPWLEDVKTKYGDSLSYADLYTLGGGEECMRCYVICYCYLCTLSVANISRLLQQLLPSKSLEAQLYSGGECAAMHNMLCLFFSPYASYLLTYQHSSLVIYYKSQLRKG